MANPRRSSERVRTWLISRLGPASRAILIVEIFLWIVSAVLTAGLAQRVYVTKYSHPGEVRAVKADSEARVIIDLDQPKFAKSRTVQSR